MFSCMEDPSSWVASSGRHVCRHNTKKKEVQNWILENIESGWDSAIKKQTHLFWKNEL